MSTRTAASRTYPTMRAAWMPLAAALVRKIGDLYASRVVSEHLAT